MSNELATPKILSCPADVGVVRAENWPQFGSIAVRRLAVSYALNLHASTDASESWLNADRNLQAQPGGVGCSANVSGFSTISGTGGFPESYATGWTNAVHGQFGHVLMTGGSVEFVSTPGLKRLMSSNVGDDGTIHFLRAR
jgi:hypothetical protein